MSEDLPRRAFIADIDVMSYIASTAGYAVINKAKFRLKFSVLSNITPLC